MMMLRRKRESCHGSRKGGGEEGEDGGAHNCSHIFFVSTCVCACACGSWLSFYVKAIVDSLE